MKQLFTTKPFDKLHEEAHGEQHGLKRSLSVFNLITLGIGAIIGAGIFVLSGQAAAQYAGPAIVLSFIVSGAACALAGLCYAEFASMIPVAGSAYTYAYATLGELMAWIIGWDLILEYLFAASTVSVGWAGYVVSFLHDFGINIPVQYTAALGTRLVEVPGEGWKVFSSQLAEVLASRHIDIASLPQVTAVLNVPAIFIVIVVTFLLILGIQESARFNNLMVIVKVSVILLLIGIGFFFVNPANWHPFIPENTGRWGHFGLSGILRGAGVIFFAYIGFDAVSTAAQEARNPKRDMPVAILGSLGISTFLYILVALVITGVVSYTMLNVPDPIAVVVNAMGDSMFWLRPVIKIAAIAGLSSVVLVLLMAQPRIFFTMSRDGLLPGLFSRIHPKFKTPYRSSLITGLFACVLAGVIPMDIISKLVSIGTLFAFTVVCLSVLILRYQRPQLPRAFVTPGVPWVPLLGALVCLVQMFSLPWITWAGFLGWMFIGLTVYFLYGKKHSKVWHDR